MRFSRFLAAGVIAALAASLGLGATSITCPGGSGAYPCGNAFAVTITVSTTENMCVVRENAGEPPTPQNVVKCVGGGNKCVKIEAKVKRIIDGAECTQTVTNQCDASKATLEFDCFGKTFKAGLVAGSNWGDVVSSGDCTKISGVTCN